MSLPLNVRHHQQDTVDSCGRACAQMVIGFEFARLGMASGTPLPDQTTIMANAETGGLANWATEPAELAAHINRGLQALPNATIWKVVEFEPSPGVTGDAANIEVAVGLFDLVVKKLNAGYPSVMMIDDNDHWETAYSWGMRDAIDFTGGTYPTTALFTIDPLPVLVSSLGTPHSDADACYRNQDTIWFFNNISVRALVCDEEPFKGSAIGIVQTNASDWWSGGFADHGRLDLVPTRRPTPDPRFGDAWREQVVIANIRDPLPPIEKNLPLISLMKFFKRDMWQMIDAMARLPEPASWSDFDWSRSVVRHAAYHKDPDRKMAIVAAPPREGKARSILLSIDQRGAVDAMHFTSSEVMVKSLASASTEPLWIMPKYSRWLPFVKIDSDGPAARFRRLYDGFEVGMTEGHGHR